MADNVKTLYSSNHRDIIGTLPRIAAEWQERGDIKEVVIVARTEDGAIELYSLGTPATSDSIIASLSLGLFTAQSYMLERE